jgi:transposase-like protein
VERMEQPGAPPDERRSGDAVTCPWCGSTDVERIGEFGPGLMTEQWMCLACHSPFEWIRKR